MPDRIRVAIAALISATVAFVAACATIACIAIKTL